MSAGPPGRAALIANGRGRWAYTLSNALAVPEGGSRPDASPFQQAVKGAGPQAAWGAPVQLCRSMMATAARNAASISKSEVSSKCASSAGLSGATARLLSRSSRALISAQHVIEGDIGASRLELVVSGARALTSGDAVMKSFTSASGHTTVPMSRPSRTAPPGRAGERRCSTRTARRTAGMAATIEAASPAAVERSSSLSRRIELEAARCRHRRRLVVRPLARAAAA